MYTQVTRKPMQSCSNARFSKAFTVYCKLWGEKRTTKSRLSSSDSPTKPYQQCDHEHEHTWHTDRGLHMMPCLSTYLLSAVLL
jgi:hypothetical protein